MKRRLFLLSGSASATALVLSACGGGGGGDATPVGSAGSVDTAALGSTVGGSAASTTAVQPMPSTDSGAATQTAATPAQPATVASATALGGLPKKILGCYFPAWGPAFRITDVPSDFNVIYLFNAQNGGTNTGDGSWTWPFVREVPAAQIQQVRQRGQKVILTIGGSGLGFVYTNRTQSTNCVNSVKAIIEQLGGVDGLDFNNYEAGIVNAGNLAAMSTEMVWIAQQLRATYGADFAITSPAGASGTTDENLMVALKKAGMLTYAAPQYYDWSGFNAIGYISNATDSWCTALGESSVCVGLSANYSNGPSLSDCTREWAAIKAAHPNIRGMFCWSAQTNLGGGNTWGRTMKAALV
ncbi:MAG: hypothetical protein NVS2B4_06870 [Ramlibacter sp.]